ncbi:Uncharacterised protein [Mycolicibacterium vanbaalenii]|uniref:Uncharacterized protein n=1 Tax=Mycolicibacterium vanbaalenii TaxID=110539 RepID=A0A5S9R518_MYCVN|nr:hypothetical protein [Mycolicibacterium vanbaalenii]CAA0130802.1 Uncharacterised protein [Mycolicibacterium vanbaalenii]
MSSSGEPMVPGADGEDSAIGVAAQRPLAVYSCSRLGRVANPPGFSLATWLRSGRVR